MFESDDYDQVLSLFDFPEVDDVEPRNVFVPESQDFITSTNKSKIVPEKINRDLTVREVHSIKNASNYAQCLAKKPSEFGLPSNDNFTRISKDAGHSITLPNLSKPKENQISLPPVDNFVSPKHLKRKIINSHFGQQSKRKFPGPAGLLNGILEEAKDESIGQIEFLSQDMDFTECNLRRDLFESPLWKRLLTDTQDWKVHNGDSIKTIKQQALTGNLRRRKAQTVTAFIEAVDRSVTDPLIILRDETGSIKCTLHRDAWSIFSPYIISEYCALVLQKPTVLTTGGAFKKHYLNITLSNILAIYSSAVLKERVLPDEYKIEYEDDFTVIKSEPSLENIDKPLDACNSAEDIFDGLDNFFSDEVF